jgi:hypothetical protein
MLGINPIADEAPKPSALENAAKVLGILTSVGSLAGNISGLFQPKVPTVPGQGTPGMIPTVAPKEPPKFGFIK